MSLEQSAASSDAGRKRRRNEDAYVCEPPLFAVADGMGGAQAGEVASRLAATALRGPSLEGPGGEEQVANLIREANRRVFERATKDAAASGMGTTMTAALVEDGTVAIGHVGDSRAYLIRDGSLEQLTEDHSLVAELVRSGKLTPEEAEAHPQRSVITRALGTEAEVDVDVFSVATQPGDIFMLCSDGLTSMVDDETILEVVERHRASLTTAATALVKEANRGGGEDNITVVLFEIGEAIEDTALLPGFDEDEAGTGLDDEATLTELDAVPTLESAVPPPEPAPKPRRRRLFRPAIVVVAVALLAIAAAVGLFALSRSYFVGAESNGRVAVYQGLPWELGGGVRLYRLVYESPLLAVQLSQAERRQLFDHDLQSKGGALREVKTFERDVVR